MSVCFYPQCIPWVTALLQFFFAVTLFMATIISQEVSAQASKMNQDRLSNAVAAVNHDIWVTEKRKELEIIGIRHWWLPYSAPPVIKYSTHHLSRRPWAYPSCYGSCSTLHLATVSASVFSISWWCTVGSKTLKKLKMSYHHHMLPAYNSGTGTE